MSGSVAETAKNLIKEKMQREGYKEYQINEALISYAKYAAGEKGKISLNEIEPAMDIPSTSNLGKEDIEIGKKMLSTGKVAVIKLSGGLGTSMGLDKAKVLLDVKPGISFLDIIQMQAVHLSKESKIPFLFMTSEHTDRDIKAKLKINLVNDIDLTFVQGEIPKIVEATGMPLECGDISKEMCPPGHGAIYSELYHTGILAKLVSLGIETIFVSNGDNLGATVEPSIIGYFIKSGAPFMMEVTRRTEADKKGGHLCVSKSSGGYMLRESAQCPDDETSQKDFQDVNKYTAFNTNSIYINSAKVLSYMEAHAGHVDLPVMINRKKVLTSTGEIVVVQLENAMGAALGTFPKATVIEVGRERFFPVKKCCDLLVLKSDIMTLTESGAMVVAAGDSGIPVSLDDNYYKNVNDFNRRFCGAISLKDCSKLSIKGDVYFKGAITFKGEVEIVNETGKAVAVAGGAVLSGKVKFD